jgi:2-methylisocitrate lyase-like PEP mutase family enzyme
VSLEETLAHLRSIAGAVTVPVNADFEGGFATDPKDVMANIAAAGIRTKSDIAAVVAAVAPKPVNVLVGSDFSTVAELAEAGVRRISVGGALARAARPPICYI